MWRQLRQQQRRWWREGSLPPHGLSSQEGTVSTWGGGRVRLSRCAADKTTVEGMSSQRALGMSQLSNSRLCSSTEETDTCFSSRRLGMDKPMPGNLRQSVKPVLIESFRILSIVYSWKSPRVLCKRVCYYSCYKPFLSRPRLLSIASQPIELILTLTTNPFSLAPYPEHCPFVNRIHSCGTSHRCSAIEMYFAGEFQSSHAWSFVVIIVTWKLFSKVSLCLNVEKNKPLVARPQKFWPRTG